MGAIIEGGRGSPFRTSPRSARLDAMWSGLDTLRRLDHWRRLDPVGTVSGSLVTVDPVGRTMDRLDHWRRLMSVVTLDNADLFVCVPGHLDKVGQHGCACGQAWPVPCVCPTPLSWISLGQ